MPDEAALASGKCPKCRGIGAEWNNSAAIPCSDCEGTGRLPIDVEREKAAFWKSQFEEARADLNMAWNAVNAYAKRPTLADLTEALDALDILLRFGGTGTYDEGVAKARAVLRKHRPPAPDSTPPRRDELDGDVPNPRQSEQEGAKGPSLLALVSKCCGADFELYSEDGTCHYICAACEKACDIPEDSHE